MAYAEKLKDPRWQKKRLEILSRDGFRCQDCFDTTKTLHVHHLDYEKNTDPWDYPDFYLLTLCEDCHKDIEEKRPEFEKTVIKLLRLSLKDTFIMHCANTVLSSYSDIHRIFFLLWELDEKKVTEVLELAYKETQKEAILKYAADGGDLPSSCMVCGSGEMVYFENYNYSKCDQCGFSVPHFEKKHPITNGK